MDKWFTTEQIDRDTYVISEYKHWEEPHCYLLCGSERSLIIDTGLGVSNIYKLIATLTDKHITAVATHIHWDHIGGHKYFPDFYAHTAELSWLNGGFPLPLEAIKKQIANCPHLPSTFDLNSYELFQGIPTKVLSGGEVLDLGGRCVEVLHTPGHSPGHMCFFESERGYLFTGDLVYAGTLLSDFPSTEPDMYFDSLKKITRLSPNRIFPGHHSMHLQPEIIKRMVEGFEKLECAGLLRHGSGVFEFNGFSIKL